MRLRLKRPLSTLATCATAAVIAAPLALFATLALLPLWSWLERSTGIEAVGHSGPADWCYLVVYAPIAVAAARLLLGRRNTRRRHMLHR